MSRRRWAAVVGALALTAVGCTSAGSTASGGAAPAGDTATHARLVAAARLDPCPTTTAAAAGSGGSAAGGLPDLTLRCLGDGPAVRLAALAGTPTVVNVWGSWCPDCRKEMPWLTSLYDAEKGRLRVLGVDSVDSDDSALDYATHVSPRMRFPSVVDPDHRVLNALGTLATPTTLLVDASGRIVHRQIGRYDSEAQLRSDIASYLHVGT